MYNVLFKKPNQNSIHLQIASIQLPILQQNIFQESVRKRTTNKQEDL